MDFQIFHHQLKDICRQTQFLYFLNTKFDQTGRSTPNHKSISAVKIFPISLINFFRSISFVKLQTFTIKRIQIVFKIFKSNLVSFLESSSTNVVFDSSSSSVKSTLSPTFGISASSGDNYIIFHDC